MQYANSTLLIRKKLYALNKWELHTSHKIPSAKDFEAFYHNFQKIYKSLEFYLYTRASLFSSSSVSISLPVCFHSAFIHLMWVITIIPAVSDSIMSIMYYPSTGSTDHPIVFCFTYSVLAMLCCSLQASLSS